jgi:hypothetical protein
MPKLTVSTSYFGSNGTVNSDAKDFFIFSIESQLTLENELTFVQAALGFNVKQVRGSHAKVAYLAPIFDNNKEYSDKQQAIRKLAEDFNQESILYVAGHSKRAIHICLDNEVLTEAIGTFTPISASEAISSGDWTLDGNQFYGIK